MKIIGTLLLLVGLIMGAVGLRMATTVESGGKKIDLGEFSIDTPKITVHNIGLMEDRRMMLYGAGLSLVLGAIFLGFGKISSTGVSATNLTHNSSSTGSVKKTQANVAVDALLARKFVSGVSISEEELGQLADNSTTDSSVAGITSRANGNSLLHIAAAKGNRLAAQKLLESGADINCRNGNGQYAYQLTNDEDLIAILKRDA